MRQHRQSTTTTTTNNNNHELHLPQQLLPQQPQKYGTIALLNLPPQTSLSLNACASQVLRTEEPLIVIHRVVPVRGFHLLVVRAGDTGSGSSGEGGGGFILHSS